jgi:hypothetical protein
MRIMRRKSLPTTQTKRNGGVSVLAKTVFLGTGFGDRFKVSRGGSRRFEEGCDRQKN